jgi:hypothetical protein
MLIGDVAKQSDVTPATIRYYEEIGLLTPPPRSEGGYRRYTPATLEELDFIKKGQGLGFSLVLDLAQRNLAAAGERIRQLQAFRDRLASQIEKWKEKPRCNARGLCEIISSAELPEKATKR